jgi:hypothetical protein
MTLTHSHFLQFTTLITFPTLFLKVFGLQGRVSKISAGNRFQSRMVLFTKEYFPIRAYNPKRWYRTTHCNCSAVVCGYFVPPGVETFSRIRTDENEVNYPQTVKFILVYTNQEGVIKSLYGWPNRVPVTLTMPGSCRGKIKSLRKIRLYPCLRWLMKIHDAAGCCELRTVAAGKVKMVFCAWMICYVPVGLLFKGRTPWLFLIDTC